MNPKKPGIRPYEPRTHLLGSDRYGKAGPLCNGSRSQYFSSTQYTTTKLRDVNCKTCLRISEDGHRALH